MSSMSPADRQLRLPLRDAARAAGGSVDELETPRIVVAASDASIGPVLETSLREAGYHVILATDGASTLELVLGGSPPNLVVLDLALPDMRGSEVLKALRSDKATRSMPVVVVTSHDTETDRVIAFELGADDFVGAPFSVREILLRVRVQLRRRDATAGRAGIISIGLLRLDRDAHRAWVDGKPISLSVREFRLLEALMERSERVLSRHALLDLVWGSNANIGVRAVDAYVTRLRRKLGAARDFVETVSSVGYRLRRPEG